MNQYNCIQLSDRHSTFQKTSESMKEIKICNRVLSCLVHRDIILLERACLRNRIGRN